MMPMREDLELAYFSIALVISYLARRLSEEELLMDAKAVERSYN
jgi:hypothetical protein